jgi:hypothetical protein
MVESFKYPSPMMRVPMSSQHSNIMGVGETRHSGKESPNNGHSNNTTSTKLRCRCSWQVFPTQVPSGVSRHPISAVMPLGRYFGHAHAQ